MTSDIPGDILPINKRAHVSSIKQSVAVSINHVDELQATIIVPVEVVERHPMAKPIGDVDIDREHAAG